LLFSEFSILGSLFCSSGFLLLSVLALFEFVDLLKNFISCLDKFINLFLSKLEISLEFLK